MNKPVSVIEPATAPVARSATASELVRGAIQQKFIMQCCTQCAAVQYPPREACYQCLSVDLEWSEVENKAQLLASTLLHSSNEPYFAQRLPWHTGLASSPTGAAFVCHLLPGCTVGNQVELSLRFDSAGRAVVVAQPEGEAKDADDSQHPNAEDFLWGVQGRVVIFDDVDSDRTVAATQLALASGAVAVIGPDQATGGADEVMIRLG